MRSNSERLIIKINPHAMVLLALIIFICLVPDDFFGLTSVYHSETPYYIDYKCLNYDFSIFFVPFILYAILSKKSYKVYFLCIMLIFRSIIFWIMGLENIFEYQGFEIILTIITGWSIFICILDWVKRYRYYSMYNLFEAICILHVISQIIGIIIGGVGFENRYNAINLDVEGTSFLYAFYILISWGKNDKYSALKKIVVLSGLLLTGARVAVILLTMILAFSFLGKKSVKRNVRYSKKRVAILLVIGLVGFCVIMLEAGSAESYLADIFSAISRIQEIINGTDVSGMGRIRSIKAGIQLLRENYWGIDCGFNILHESIRNLGYPTFPHSVVLTYRILFGPVIFMFVLYNIVRCIHKSLSINIKSMMFLGLFLLLSGGPVINFKLILFYFWMFWLSTNDNKEQEIGRKNEGIGYDNLLLQ